MDTPAGFSPPLLFYFISLSLSGGLIYSFHESWGNIYLIQKERRRTILISALNHLPLSSNCAQLAM